MLERMAQYLQSLQQMTSDVDFYELSEALQAAMEKQHLCDRAQRKKSWVMPLKKASTALLLMLSGCLKA